MRISDWSSYVCSSDLYPHPGTASDAHQQPLRLFQIEERAQLLGAGWMAQFAQRLGLYLTNPLAGDIELLADLFQGVVGIHVDAKTHAQHLGLARGQASQYFTHGFHQAGGDRKSSRLNSSH